MTCILILFGILLMVAGVLTLVIRDREKEIARLKEENDALRNVAFYSRHDLPLGGK